MNAVKHGLTAQTAVLPGEDAAELRQFAESLEAQLSPAGPLQKVLVQRIVAVTWKLRRVAAAEAAAVAQMEEERLGQWERVARMEAQLPSPFGGPGPRPGPRDGGTLLADSFREEGRNGTTAVDGPLIRLTAYELKLEGSLRASMRELRALQKDEHFASSELPGANEPAPGSGESAALEGSPPQAGRLNGAPRPAPPDTVSATDADFPGKTPARDSASAASQNELPADLPTPDPTTNEGAGP